MGRLGRANDPTSLMRILRLAAMAMSLTASAAAASDLFESVDDFLIGELPEISDEPVKLGNITSVGNGPSPYVRPTERFDLDRDFRFYPAFTEAPPSPAQSSVTLTEHTPVTLVIPGLGSFPWLHTLDVAHSIDGFEIAVNADVITSMGATATIYGPNEYLLPLGSLSAGHYRLTLTRTISNEFGVSSVFHFEDESGLQLGSGSTGFIEFTVHAVPEPFSAALLTTGFGCLAIARWLRRPFPRRNAPTERNWLRSLIASGAFLGAVD